MVNNNSSPCPYLDPQAFNCILSSCLVNGGGVIEQLDGHLAASQGQSTSNMKISSIFNSKKP